MYNRTVLRERDPTPCCSLFTGQDESGLRSKGHKVWAWALNGLSLGAICLWTLAVSSCGKLACCAALPMGRKEITGAARSCLRHSPFHWWGEQGPLPQLVHPGNPERTSTVIYWTIQLLFIHSPKIVAEQGLKSWSFVFRIRVEVGELTLAEWKQQPDPMAMASSELFHDLFADFRCSNGRW